MSWLLKFSQSKKDYCIIESKETLKETENACKSLNYEVAKEKSQFIENFKNVMIENKFLDILFFDVEDEAGCYSFYFNDFYSPPIVSSTCDPTIYASTTLCSKDVKTDFAVPEQPALSKELIKETSLVFIVFIFLMVAFIVLFQRLCRYRPEQSATTNLYSDTPV